MKNILFVVDERRMGGVSYVLEKLFKALNNVQFDLLVLHDNGDCLENIDNVNMFFGTPFFEVVDLSLKDVIKSKNIKRIIKKLYLIFLMKTGLIKGKVKKERKKMNLKQYDVEISFKDGFGTYFVAYGDAKEKIRWLHADYSNNDPGRKYKKSFTDALNQYNQFVAISKSVAKKFNDKYGKKEITTVIYNLFNMAETPITVEEKNNKKLNIVTVGRLHRIKGYDRLFRALGRIKQDGNLENISLKIVGDGEEEENLTALAKELNLEKEIEFLGRKDNPWHYIKDGDLFVLTSLSEAFPSTVIESLLMHIPVLSVEYSSAYEMIENNKNGIIVENSEDGIYQGLNKILKDKELLLQLKQGASEYTYNNEEIIKNLEKVLGVKNETKDTK